MNRRGKFICALMLSLSAAVLFSGCTTKLTARAGAQQAYLAGQNAQLQQQLAAQFTGVTIVGPVQNPQVPWVAGLTLAQAVATANYVGAQPPEEIIITRQGESASVDPDVLLDGTDVPLEAGDVVELRP
jgi:uncharacterized protein YceK